MQVNLIELENLHQAILEKCFPLKSPKEISFKDKCEIIEKSKLLQNKDGTYPTAEEVFNYSPTGALYEIEDWFFAAAIKLFPELKQLEERAIFK